MAELLSHVLHAYVVFTVVSWGIGWLDRRWVVVAMVGAILPDLAQIGLFLDSDTITALFGIPFAWDAIHTLGGLLLLAAVGAMLFQPQHRRIAFGMQLGGGSLHLLVDGMKRWADGANGAYLYPLSWWRNPTPGWYVSADRWVLVGSVVVAVVILVIDVYRRRTGEEM